jgi:hypothetical protein
MRGNIAPHDIIYYHLILSARKILFSLFQAGTCRPPSAISAAAGHPSAYDLRTPAATPPRVPCPTAPAPMERGQPRHQSPARRHAMRMAIPPPIRLPRPVPAVAAALLPLRCAQIGPRSRGHLYITCSQLPTVAGSNVFWGRTWGPGRARTRWPCRAEIVAHRIARPPHAMAAALFCQMWVTWPPWVMARRCALVRERRNAGTVFAFLAWVRIYCPQPPDKANALPVGWSIKTAFPFLVCVFDRPPQR